MRRLATVFLALIVLPILAADNAREERIRGILQERVDAGKSVGLVGGIVDENGAQVIGCGRLSRNSDSSINGDTFFEIGSISKAFTGVLLALAVQRGDVRLEDTVSKHLPEKVKLPSLNETQITLQHLANHSSGLPRMPNNFRPKDAANPYADYSVQNMYDFLCGHTLRRSPGEKYEYSNLGVGLLGHVLALKAETDYEKLVIERVCKPLGMNDTRIRLSPEDFTRMAKPHDLTLKEVKNWDIMTFAGAGGLRSTVNDMLKFVAANCGLQQSELASAMNESHGHRASTGSGAGQVALGWHVSPKGKNEIIWHNGGTGGYRTFVGFIKEKRLGVVVLNNSENSVDDIGFRLLSE